MLRRIAPKNCLGIDAREARPDNLLLPEKIHSPTQLKVIPGKHFRDFVRRAQTERVVEDGRRLHRRSRSASTLGESNNYGTPRRTGKRKETIPDISLSPESRGIIDCGCPLPWMLGISPASHSVPPSPRDADKPPGLSLKGQSFVKETANERDRFPGESLAITKDGFIGGRGGGSSEGRIDGASSE